jgi:hypothetical protein
MSGEPVDSVHTDVGAYAMGLLEARDRQAFEEHLAGCPVCAAELAEMSGMKDLLSDLGPDFPAPVAGPPGQAEVADLVRRRAQNQRRHARWQILLGTAAAVVLLAGGVAAGLAAAGRPAPAGKAGTTFTAVDKQTGVHGVVTLVPKPFGAQVTVDLAKITGPLECQFFAVPRTGKPFLIGTWFLRPGPDFGTHGHPPMQLEGWTTIPLRDIAQIEIVAKGHGTEVSIPTRRSGTA